MQSNRNSNEKPSSTEGLRVIFSEKALLALLHVILALGVAYLQMSSSANQETPAKVLQSDRNQ